MEGNLPAQANRQDALVACVGKKETNGQATHQGDIRQLHTRDRRRARGGIVRLGGRVRVLNGGKIIVEEKSRPTGRGRVRPSQL